MKRWSKRFEFCYSNRMARLPLFLLFPLASCRAMKAEDDGRAFWSSAKDEYGNAAPRRAVTHRAMFRVFFSFLVRRWLQSFLARPKRKKSSDLLFPFFFLPSLFLSLSLQPPHHSTLTDSAAKGRSTPRQAPQSDQRRHLRRQSCRGQGKDERRSVGGLKRRRPSATETMRSLPAATTLLSPSPTPPAICVLPRCGLAPSAARSSSSATSERMTLIGARTAASFEGEGDGRRDGSFLLL